MEEDWGWGGLFWGKKVTILKKNWIQPPPSHLLVPSGPNPHLYLCYCPRLFRVPDWATFIHCGSNQWKLWFLGVLKWWNCARHDARRSCSVSVCCEKKQTRFLFSELHCSLGRGCDVCWSCVSASNEFPNLDIMKSHLSVSAGVTILMMTLGRDQLHIRGISFVPVLMLAGADRKLWPWHERQAHPATCYTPRTKERAKVVTNGGLFVKAHTPTRVVQAALRAETSWARIRVNTTWKRFKGTSEAIPESVAEMQSVL